MENIAKFVQSEDFNKLNNAVWKISDTFNILSLKFLRN
jgi:hypothetical protein